MFQIDYLCNIELDTLDFVHIISAIIKFEQKNIVVDLTLLFHFLVHFLPSKLDEL